MYKKTVNTNELNSMLEGIMKNFKNKRNYPPEQP